MFKKFFIFTLLVIILVSLNWFKVIFAQDLENLSLSEKEALLKKFKGKSIPQKDSYLYKSADIFQNDNPADKTETNILETHRAGRSEKTNINKGKLQPFDKLLPFGMELFKGNAVSDVATDIPSASDYILGPGDNIIIYLWGRVEKEFNLIIDREGRLFIPQVGELIGWGLTLEQFTAKAKKKFSKVYSDFDLTVSLGKIRSIRIYVTGEVKNPGAYTLSSLTSMFNALYLAGGPNMRGSMRQIKLMRNGKPKAIVDLYKLLLEGDIAIDARLQTGDVIFVPVAGPRVAIRGEINRSAIYELKGSETALDLLKLAGKATPEAYLERVMLERIAKAGEWQVLDLNLNENKSDEIDNIKLFDGDRLSVYSIFEFKKNIVAVFGMVKHQGYYERSDSSTVASMINQAQLRPYDVYIKRADLFRRHTNRELEIIPIDLEEILKGTPEADYPLEDRDSLYIYSIDEVEWKKYVYIEGEVNNPGRYLLYENMTVEDLIFLAGSFTLGAIQHQAEIARIDSMGKVTIINYSIDEDQSGNNLLQENDHLYIRQKPEWKLHRSVTIEGEVLFPGEYTLTSRKETLYQLIKRVGGFTKFAFPKGIIFKRSSINENLKRLKIDEVIEKSTIKILDSLGNIINSNHVDYNDNSMDRIIIAMDKILSTNGKEGDIILESNDKIYIPKVPPGVSIVGAVGANGTLKYISNKNVKYYIKHAGNFTRRADKKETRLIKATGEVISGRGILGKRIEIGDVIVVPSKINKERNLLGTLTNTLSAITGALTTVYIISKL
ncbi:MAG: SLBB domain-containing protein [Candidatus Zixiibacteriota bacterium]